MTTAQLITVLLLIASVGAFVLAGIGLTKEPRTYGQWTMFLAATALLILSLERLL